MFIKQKKGLRSAHQDREFGRTSNPPPQEVKKQKENGGNEASDI
jgi:hypothetical protein